MNLCQAAQTQHGQTVVAPAAAALTIRPSRVWYLDVPGSHVPLTVSQAHLRVRHGTNDSQHGGLRMRCPAVHQLFGMLQARFTPHMQEAVVVW